jgi:hypothetical protein
LSISEINVEGVCYSTLSSGYNIKSLYGEWGGKRSYYLKSGMVPSTPEFIKVVMEQEYPEKIDVVILDYAFKHLIPSIKKAGYRGNIVVMGDLVGKNIEGADVNVELTPVSSFPERLKEALAKSVYKR